MKKIILSLLVLSIVLIGISAAAASDVDNIDVDDLEDNSIQSESPDVSSFNRGNLDDILNDIISQIKETQNNGSSCPSCNHPPYEVADDSSSDIDSNNFTYDGNYLGSDVVNNYEPDNSDDVVHITISKKGHGH